MDETPTINNLEELKRVLEAALLAADSPLSLREMKRMFEHELSEDMLRRALDELKTNWEGRGTELVQVAEGWRFQTRPEMQPYLARMRNEKPPRYSRAVLETLAIIAYRQPVTRGDVEDIRGVSVNAQIIKTLEDRGWIEAVGHRDVPGRPALFATTPRFLSDLGLRSLQELPPLEELGNLLAPDTAVTPEELEEVRGEISTEETTVAEIQEIQPGPQTKVQAAEEINEDVEAESDATRTPLTESESDPDSEKQALAAAPSQHHE
ncbi:MAG: SMC-Scp complex subunit ScpB [Hydrogenophilaceae bacterium]|nr:SMC-Scp complex subunit ScpB [Hydrogenophilaceae bacterium]